MKYINYKFILLSFFSIAFTKLYAQQAIVSVGANDTGSGGSNSYSIGQTIYITNTGSTNSTAQGVQQPYEISLNTVGISSMSEKIITSIYPNPTIESITITVENIDSKDLSYLLTDVNGKSVENNTITSSTTHISMAKLASSTYFLTITSRNKETQSFKIIKN